MGLIMAIDQGSHSTRALALDQTGAVRCAVYEDVSLRRRTADVVEQDAAEILASTRSVVARILDHDAVRRHVITAAGLATQRSSVVAWDLRDGRPLSPVISWQDRRTRRWLSNLMPEFDRINRITGLPLSPHYGAGKLRWLLDHSPPVAQARRKGRLALGPLAGFLLFNLLRSHPFTVDHANALRTQLVDLDTLDWDPFLLERFGIPRSLLPECRCTSQRYGVLRAADIPVTAVNGDQTAALYCLGKPVRTTALINIGTGAFVLLPTGNRRAIEPALLSGLSESRSNRREYVLEGTVNGAGAALQWAAERWGLEDPISRLDQWLRRTGQVPVFLNTVGGLGSPWWRQGPLPRLKGRSEHPWQKATAVIESVLFLLFVNIERMMAAGHSIRRLQVSGGLARIDAVCQRLADLTRLPVYRPAETEATARGIAWLAAGRPIPWPKPGKGRHFKPNRVEGLIKRYQEFLGLIDSALSDREKP